jgi:hypothetical protein
MMLLLSPSKRHGIMKIPKKERKKWREAIRLEFRQMLKNMVWSRKKGINVLPPGRKGIGTKWVFKKKKNGVYRA